MLNAIKKNVINFIFGLRMLLIYSLEVSYTPIAQLWSLCSSWFKIPWTIYIWSYTDIVVLHAGFTLYMLFADWPKSRWSSCSWNCSHVQDWQVQIWVNCSELDTKVCHGLDPHAIKIIAFFLSILNFPFCLSYCLVEVWKWPK